MKHGTKPTRTQRKLMEKWKVNTQDWLVERETNNELVLRHRHFDKTKIIPKGGAPRSESELIACRGQAHHRKR